MKKGSSAKLTCYWSGPWIVCAEPTSSETLLRIAPDPSWAKQLRNNGTQVMSIDRLKLFNNAKAVRVPECEDALDMDDDEFAENITLPTKNEPQVATAGTGTSGGGGAGGATDEPDTREDKPPTPAGLAPGPWRATPRKSSSSSTGYTSESSSTSQNTEKDLLDGTTASEVPGESFLLTPPRFEFNEPHVDAPVPMDTTTPGPSKPTAVPSQRDPTARPSKIAATPAKQPVEDPSPSTGVIRKRSHGATPFGMKGVVRRSDSQTPILDQSVVIPVEGIPQEYLEKYSRVFRTPRVPAKKFIQEEEVVASRPGVLWARFPAHLSPESGSVRMNGTPLRRVGAMTLFSITRYKEDVFSSNSQE